MASISSGFELIFIHFHQPLVETEGYYFDNFLMRLMIQIGWRRSQLINLSELPCRGEIDTVDARLSDDRALSKPEFTTFPPCLFSRADCALIPSCDGPLSLVAIEFCHKSTLSVGSRLGDLDLMPGQVSDTLRW